MPDDKFNGKYIDQALVKGVWYGISSGPKPQVYIGSINSDPESLRNRSVIVNSSTSGTSGKFPSKTAGHDLALLTIRYGEGLYIQKAVDTTTTIEWERVYVNGSWGDWARVTSVGDSSDIANEALKETEQNTEDINKIYKAIGGKDKSPKIISDVNALRKNLDDFFDDYRAYKSTNDSNIASVKTGGMAFDRVARERTNYIVNNDVRTGQYPGIKFYTNTNQFALSNKDSVLVIAQDTCTNWGIKRKSDPYPVNGTTNSVFIAANASGGLCEAHVTGGTYVPPSPNDPTGGGWYVTFDRFVTGDIQIAWTLIVFDQQFTY